MLKAKKNSITKNNNTAFNLGFKAKLWQAADALRNNMDAAENALLGALVKPFFGGNAGNGRIRVIRGVDPLAPGFGSDRLSQINVMEDTACFQRKTIKR